MYLVLVFEVRLSVVNILWFTKCSNPSYFTRKHLLWLHFNFLLEALSLLSSNFDSSSILSSSIVLFLFRYIYFLNSCLYALRGLVIYYFYKLQFIYALEDYISLFNLSLDLHFLMSWDFFLIPPQLLHNAHRLLIWECLCTNDFCSLCFPFFGTRMSSSFSILNLDSIQEFACTQ